MKINSQSQLHKEDMQDQQLDFKKCRVCLEEYQEKLMTLPCLCKGSLAHIHQNCFSTWVGHSAKRNIDRQDDEIIEVECQICKQKMRYRWIEVRKCKKISEVPVRLSWMFIPIVLLTILFVVLSIIWIRDGVSSDDEDKIITGSIFMGVAALLICGCLGGVYNICCITRTENIEFIEIIKEQKQQEQ